MALSENIVSYATNGGHTMGEDMPGLKTNPPTFGTATRSFEPAMFV